MRHRRIEFTPTADFNGLATLQINTDDQGNTGGPAQSALNTVNIMSAQPTMPRSIQYPVLKTPAKTLR